MLALAAIGTLLVSCQSSHDSAPMMAVDLIAQLSRAECRPAGRCEAVFAGDRYCVRLPAPGRLTWTLAMPHHAALRTEVSAIDGPVGFRVGIADSRTYEVLTTSSLTPPDGWNALVIDLSAYAGWKWSLFYHPDRIAWRIVLSTDAVHGRAGIGLWCAPVITTRASDVPEYRRRAF
jgi:hypothetical protein